MAAREIVTDGWRVRLDTAGQVLAVEVPEFDGRYRADDEERVIPVLPPPGDGPVSAATLILKAKQFDDGLMAAAELAAQRGIDRFAGKANFLSALAGALGRRPAAVPVLAACQLGNVAATVPPDLEAAVADASARFTADALRSRPLGFYTWTPELEAVFRQDRFLQQPLDNCVADDATAALDRVSDGRRTYDALLSLATRLTNPPAGPSLKATAGKRSFLPASRSHEGRLVERLFGDRPIPDGFDLMAELIRRVRAVEIDLTPAADAGWYDWQTWALEPLVAPDRAPGAARLALGPRYRQHLEDLFRGALALTRETHVKQTGIAVAGCAGPRWLPIYVGPALRVEPVPEVYARRAAGYRFVRDALDESFGAGWTGLRRLTADGPVKPTLGDELTHMEQLFRGAAAASNHDLGAGPADGADAFEQWRAGLSDDPDVARDARMMVPVFYDVGRRKTKVWAFLGWRTVSVDTKYRERPRVVAVEPATPPMGGRLAELRRKFHGSEPVTHPPAVEFVGDAYEFVVPVVVEAYVSRLMNRDEFRRHCDRHGTRSAILRHLG